MLSQAGLLDAVILASPTRDRDAEAPGALHVEQGHPAPYTLHPKPYTLHPTPYTLHPTPCTLHPTPYTLHPTPYTLNPNPHPGSRSAIEKSLSEKSLSTKPSGNPAAWGWAENKGTGNLAGSGWADHKGAGNLTSSGWAGAALGRRLGGEGGEQPLQGYLAHKKHPPPLGSS